jgi:5'-nucleotidase
VHLTTPAGGFAAGQAVAVDLSSLLFSTSEPKDAVVAATFNGQSVGSFPVDPTVVNGTDEVGRATVGFVVPQSAAPLAGAPAVRNLVVTGTTTGTTVTVPISVAALHPQVTCTTTTTGQHNGTMNVTSGVACLDGGTVTGSLTVGAGATLYARGIAVNGGLKAMGAAEIDLIGGTINGGMTLNSTAGAALLSGNRINGGLSCTGNAVPPVDNGQPNKVNGSKSGQCARL